MLYFLRGGVISRLFSLFGDGGGNYCHVFVRFGQRCTFQGKITCRNIFNQDCFIQADIEALRGLLV